MMVSRGIVLRTKNISTSHVDLCTFMIVSHGVVLRKRDVSTSNVDLCTFMIVSRGIVLRKRNVSTSHSNRPAPCLAHLVGMKPNFQGCYCG